MVKVFHRKLIRDKIPQVIEAAGDKYEIRIMGEKEIDFKLIKGKQVQKRKERGGFKKRLFLIWSSQEARK